MSSRWKMTRPAEFHGFLNTSTRVETPQFKGYLTHIYSKVYDNVTLLKPPGWKSYKATTGLTIKESSDIEKAALKACRWQLKLQALKKEKGKRLAELEEAERKRAVRRESSQTSRKKGVTKAPKEQLELKLKPT